MLDSTWSPEQLAVLVLIALVASCVIGIVILSSPPRSFIYAALAGLCGGIILRLTPAGQKIAQTSTGLAVWIVQPLFGVGFALLVAGLFELLFSPNVPVLGRARGYGRRALRPWQWGSAAEIAERAGVASWVPGVLGLGIEPRPLTAPQLMAQARIVASVLCGSCVGVFFALPAFRDVLAETLTLGNMLISLIATAFVTYLLGPLHEEVLQLADHGSPRVPKGPRGRLVANGLLFAVTGILLVLLQAVHTAIDRQIETLSLYQWILLLEWCALPLLVTAYYFGAALYRVELGEKRWDRALEASIFAGTVALAPYAIIYWLMHFFPADFRVSLIETISDSGVNSGQIAVVLIGAFIAILVGIGTAMIASATTYGIYAIALGLAMLNATRDNIRLRSCVAVLIAGAIAQGILSLAVWYFGVEMPARHYLHLVVAAGWAVGLYASQFQEEMPQAEPVTAHTA